MIAFKRHVGIMLKHSKYIIFIILTAQADQHSSFVLSDHEFLKRPPIWVDINAKHPVLTADTFPKGLIAIQHYNFIWRTLYGIDFPCG